MYFLFFRSMEKMAWDGPKWGQEDFFLLIQTLPTFWAERIWLLRSFIFLIFWIPNFWTSRSPDCQIPRTRPGPSLGGLGPAPALLRGGSAVALRHSRTTKLVRSKELGQYRENPISASPVWGITKFTQYMKPDKGWQINGDDSSCGSISSLSALRGACMCGGQHPPPKRYLKI